MTRRIMADDRISCNQIVKRKHVKKDTLLGVRVLGVKIFHVEQMG